MVHKPGRRTPAAFAVLVAAAIGLSACGSFDSAGSGKSVVTDFVNKNAPKGRFTIKSLTCPSGVKQTVGNSYVCQLTLHVNQSGADQKYTVRVHIVAGNKVEVGRTDVVRLS